MKRALLIAGGTVGGLGAVLSVTPPALNSNGLSTIAGASADTSSSGTSTNNQNSAAAVTTAAPTATESAAAVATKKATTKKSTTTSSSSSTSNSTSTTATATPTPTATMIAASGVSGSFTGDQVNVGYGIVQVKITVSNGKITDAVALSAPSGRNQRWTDMAIPNLRQQTLSANSAAITGVSGASYTSYGWYKSLISALQNAGMSTGV